MSYNTKNYEKQGGADWVIGGRLLPATEVQAAHIPNPTDLATAIVAITALTAALQGVGITAAS